MIEITVLGLPATQGSKTGRPFRRRDGSLGIAMTEGKSKEQIEKLSTWRGMIAMAASMQMQTSGGAQVILDGPVIVEARFYLPRPKSAAKKLFPDTRPDLDKLQRAVGDALKGIVYTEDSRIVDWDPKKRFCDNWTHGVPGVLVTVRSATEADL